MYKNENLSKKVSNDDIYSNWLRFLSWHLCHDYIGLWIGLSETTAEGSFTWDSTGKRLSPGYQAWYPGEPSSTCAGGPECVFYTNVFPGWVDYWCGGGCGGICELQP